MGGELAEAVFAVVGETSGAPPADKHDDDHGCTPLMHHCGCCRAILAEDALVEVTIPIPARSIQRSVFLLSRPHAEPDGRNLLRPPAA